MIISRTPYRVSFFGGGTDYPVWYEKNGGAVLSTTIDKYCYIICRSVPPVFTHSIRLVWSKIELPVHVDEIEHPTSRETLKFVGVTKNIEIHHQGDLPARSGMGSSSSFTVGLLNALHTLRGEPASKRQLALDAIHIEQERVKESVGSQDQIAAAFGGFNKITFGGPEKFKVESLNPGADKLKALEDRLMLFFTGHARNASEIAAEQIKNTPKKENELRLMRDMVDEAVKTLNGPDALFSDFGRLLNESWQIKRTLSSVIATPAIDDIYEAALDAGALGGKLLGAGGGGFILFFVEPEFQPKVKEKLKSLFYMPLRFEDAGSQIIHNTTSS